MFDKNSLRSLVRWNHSPNVPGKLQKNHLWETLEQAYLIYSTAWDFDKAYISNQNVQNSLHIDLSFICMQLAFPVITAGAHL